ncbi:thiamine pyrophosphate-binding protein [Nocardioides hungaricus]
MLARVVGEGLVDAGVDQMFGVLGSGNLQIVSHAVDAGASFLHARHENAAMMMAAAYTEVSGRSAVCAVHQGPGMTNALTGLVECAKRRLPAVLLAAATARDASRRNFYVDQERLAIDCGADVLRVRVDAETPVVEQLHAALHRARARTRPLVINVPVADLSLAAVEERRDAGELASWRPDPQRPSAGAVRAVVDAIGRATRPVVLVGRGAVLSPGGVDAARSLAIRLGAPAGTTVLAHGATRGYAQDLGIVGGFSHPEAAETVRTADLVIAVGASLSPWTTRDGSLLSSRASVVHISTTEPDPAFAREYIPCRGDVAQILGEVVALMPAATTTAAPWSDLDSEALRGARWDERPYEDVSRPGSLDPRTVAKELERLLPSKKTLVLDGGDNVGYGTLFMQPAPDGRSFVFTCAGFQSIGLGIAAGIGVAQARPEQLTVISLGDCGALMAAGELDTIARSPVPVVVVVYNDAAAGAEVHHFRDTEARVDLAQFPVVDFHEVAAGHGLEATVVAEIGDLASLTTWLGGRRERSLLLDVRIDPEIVLEWAAEAFV